MNENHLDENKEMNNLLGSEIELEEAESDSVVVPVTPYMKATELIEMDNEEEQNNIEEQEELTEAQLLKKKSEEIKEQFENTVVAETNFELKNSEGEYISPRLYGTAKLESIPIEQIKLPPRARVSEQDVFALQEQIKFFGLLEPIHVVEHGDFYLLLHGYRRIQAYINLGYTEIYAIVDTTIPPELVRYYEGVINSVADYKFSEKLGYGQFFKNNQPTVGYETIEGILGLRAGEFLKALYINELKVEFNDIYMQVEKGKISIEQGFKKIEKEIEKREKEESKALDDLNSGALDDQLISSNELLDLHNDAGTQELGKRKVLDPVLRRSIENRDGGYCQCCGYGKDEPDLMGVFNIHHMVAVQYGGSDNKSNLILICNNCHTLVHDYEKGRFLPEEKTYERLPYVQKIVVLGNILATMKQKGLAYVKSKHPDVFRQIEAGKTTIGQALLKLNVDLKGEEFFNGSPYQTFVDCAYNIDNDIHDSELQKVNWGDTEDDLDNEFADTKELPTDEQKEVVADTEFLDSYMSTNQENTEEEKLEEEFDFSELDKKHTLENTESNIEEEKIEEESNISSDEKVESDVGDLDKIFNIEEESNNNNIESTNTTDDIMDNLLDQFK